MQLTPSIQRFFEAERQGDVDALADAFLPDAVVHDEGRSHTGHAAIRDWWRDAKARTPHVVEPLGTVDRPDQVRARVSGSFPGSPVELTFAFAVEGDRIAALEITP